MKLLADYKFHSIKNFQSSPKNNIGTIPHIDELQIQKESICAKDSRVQAQYNQAPYKYICELHLSFNNYLFRASGFFIGPKCVITAGHCLYHHEMGWVTSVKVIPGAFEEKEPFSSDFSNTFQTTKLWYKNAIDDYDYGAIFLDSNKLYERIGGCLSFDKLDKSRQLLNTGYPMDKKSVQVENSGFPEDISNTRRLYYMIDTNKGSSGSPVLYSDGEKSTVVGVHTEGGCPNSAIKVNNEVVQIWGKWVEMSNKQKIS